VRRVLLVALLLLSPIAIVAWILPGTQRIWKMWWENFTKLLLMFPLIILLFSVGRVFAYVFSQTINEAGILEMFVIVISVFAPIAMIPLTYKAAGLGLGAIAGAVSKYPNQWTGSAGERGRKKGKERRKKWAEDASREQLFNPDSRLGKLNKPATWAVAPMSNAALKWGNTRAGAIIPGFRGRGLKVAESIHKKQAEQTGKLFQEMNNMFGNNDKAYRALSGAWYGFDTATQQALFDAGLATGEVGTESFMAKSNFGSYDNLTKLQGILANSDDANERIAAGAIQANIPLLATKYSDPEMGYSNMQAASLIGLASHGFADERDLVNVGNSMLSKPGSEAGQVQWALAQAELGAARAGRSDIKPGYGHTYDKGAHRIIGGSDADRDIAWLETMGLGDIASAKGGMFEKNGKRKLFTDVLKAPKNAQTVALAEQYKALRAQGLSAKQIRQQHGSEMFRAGKMMELNDRITTMLGQSLSPYAQPAAGVQVAIGQIFGDAGVDAPDARQWSREEIEARIAEGQPPPGPDPGTFGGEPPGGANPFAGGGGPFMGM
jgi:hypothetical protein